MVRQLYIILLGLHPARFRYRFALEMLAIFDEASLHGSRLPLLADGVRSLVRQRVNPYGPRLPQRWRPALAYRPSLRWMPLCPSGGTSWWGSPCRWYCSARSPLRSVAIGERAQGS